MAFGFRDGGARLVKLIRLSVGNGHDSPQRREQIGRGGDEAGVDAAHCVGPAFAFIRNGGRIARPTDAAALIFNNPSKRGAILGLLFVRGPGVCFMASFISSSLFHALRGLHRIFQTAFRNFSNCA